MATERLPAPRRAATTPTPTAPVLVGEVLHARNAGQRQMIRNTQWAYLTPAQAVLDGPLVEVGEITAILRTHGELRACTPATPSLRGVMVTLTLVPPAVPGRTQLGPAPTVKPWTARRKAVVFGAVIPGVLVAGLVLALLWPLPTVGVSAVLLLLAVWRHRAQSRHDGNVPHVAIHHID
jgi:hypothetical protein